MQLQSTVLDPVGRARILARARPALPERAATKAFGALAWARVSKSVQDSIDDQLAEIRKHAKAHGVPVVRERFATGSRWNHKSAEWRALLEDIESAEYSHLWLFKADRLACDDMEMVALVRHALQKGMQVRDTVVGVVDDNNVGFLGMMSHHDIKVTSERTILKLEGLPAKGVKVGSIPYGYQPQCRVHPCKCGRHGRHVPDPARKEHVIGLFARYDGGASLPACQQWFNAVSGKRCSLANIKQMLSNAYYMGVIVGRKTRYSKTLGRYGRPKGEWDMGRHEHPIIEEPVFERVQARLQTQPRVGQQRRSGPAHPLVGLLWCAHCGRRLKFHRTRPTSCEWRCEVCYMTRGARKVERAIVGVLAEIPFPTKAAASAYAEHRAGEHAELNSEIKALDAQLDAITRKRSVWADMVAEEPPSMSREDYRAKIAESDELRASLRAKREDLSGQVHATPAYGEVARETLARLSELGNWTAALGDSSEERQRGLYSTVLSRGVIDPANQTLTVEYTDALARWCGRPSDTVPLPSQKAARQAQ